MPKGKRSRVAEGPVRGRIRQRRPADTPCQDRALQQCALRARLPAGSPSRIAGIRLLDKGPPGQRCARWQGADRTAPLRSAPRTRRRPSTGKRSRPPQWMPFETSRALSRGLEVPDTESAYQPFAVVEASHATRERLPLLLPRPPRRPRAVRRRSLTVCAGRRKLYDKAGREPDDSVAAYD